MSMWVAASAGNTFCRKCSERLDRGVPALAIAGWNLSRYCLKCVKLLVAKMEAIKNGEDEKGSNKVDSLAG